MKVATGHTRVTVGLLRDMKSAANSLRRGLLARGEAERCVAERTHLAALARNPSSPADLVEQLAIDPYEAVRLAVSFRFTLDETRRMTIDFQSGGIRQGDVGWVRDGLADPKVLLRAATSAHPLLRRTAAQSFHLPPSLVSPLVRTEDPLVEDLLEHAPTRHPGGDPDACVPEARRDVLRPDRGVTPVGVSPLATRTTPTGCRQLAVRGPSATPALIERLSPMTRLSGRARRPTTRTSRSISSARRSMSPNWPPARAPTRRSARTRWLASWTGPVLPPHRRAEPPRSRPQSESRDPLTRPASHSDASLPKLCPVAVRRGLCKGCEAIRPGRGYWQICLKSVAPGRARKTTSCPRSSRNTASFPLTRVMVPGCTGFSHPAGGLPDPSDSGGCAS